MFPGTADLGEKLKNNYSEKNIFLIFSQMGRSWEHQNSFQMSKTEKIHRCTGTHETSRHHGSPGRTPYVTLAEVEKLA